MHPGLFSIVLEKLTDDANVGPEITNLVVAACQGEEPLGKLLDGNVAPEFPDLTARTSALQGAYLKSVTVCGFRGIGGPVCLSLTPGPGLTVVLGRNGSGKSSVAESLELLLTGDNSRWKDRTAVWGNAWRNLHDQRPPKVEAEFSLASGSTVKVTRSWTTEQDYHQGELVVQELGKPKGSLQALGWQSALGDYRPFLSHNELGGALTGKPSALYDELFRILGLGELSDGERRLAERRKLRDGEDRAFKQQVAELTAELKQSPDERASAIASILGAKKVNWAQVEAKLTPAAGESTGELERLRRVAQVQIPTVDADLVSSYRAAWEELHALRQTEASRARQLAALLENALAFQHAHQDADCPVCGAEGRWGEPWPEQARAQVTQLRGQAKLLDELHSRLHAAEPLLRSTMPPPPLGVSAEAREAWEQWSAGRGLEGPALCQHLTGPLLEKLSTLLGPEISQAQLSLQNAEVHWRPLLARLDTLLAAQKRLSAGAESAKHLAAAEKWIKDASHEIRAQRFLPIAEETKKHWDQLRQDSNVKLTDVGLDGASTQRRLRLGVAVDGAENVALGVMSQGELNSLALSLFLPRATQPESPFRFLCIDDPVQAMDPAKVEGLARVLEEVARTRQVVVFTHDSRLDEAIRHLGIDATIVEVVRREKSVVELRPGKEPMVRAIDDARALLLTRELPEKVVRRVVPSFCRRALEIALLQRYRLNFPYDPELVDQADTLNKKASLAFFGSTAQVAEVASRVNSVGREWAQAYFDCNKGSHVAYDGNLERLVDDVQRLSRQLVAR